jgi:hypothetical protein
METPDQPALPAGRGIFVAYSAAARAGSTNCDR